MTSIERLGGEHLPIVESLLWSDEQATGRFAARLAAQPALADCFITLQGDLGAGKTSFVRHLLQALGVGGRIKSPTYAVLESYTVDGAKGAAAGPLQISHFDFFRFDDPQEWEDAGFRDVFASAGLKLAEWPQKAAEHLPPADLAIDITVRPDGVRVVQLCAHSRVGAALLQALPADAAPPHPGADRSAARQGSPLGGAESPPTDGAQRPLEGP